jgi:cobalt/nickel transport system permease protein
MAMHASIFDSYQAGSSLIHKLDPRVKIVITIFFILSNALIPDGAWIIFGMTWLSLVLVDKLAGLQLSYLLKRSFIALPFAIAAITVIFNIPGNSLYSFQVGARTLTITDAGLIRFISILLRSWLSVQAAILLISTTRFPDLIHGFRHLKTPQAIVSIIAFMYRYLFVLNDELIRILRARQARSAKVPGQKSGGTLSWRAKVAGNIAGQLFLRSYERSDRVYNAMLARGYQGELLTMNPHNMQSMDWNALLLAVAWLLFLQFLTILL